VGLTTGFAWKRMQASWFRCSSYNYTKRKLRKILWLCMLFGLVRQLMLKKNLAVYWSFNRNSRAFSASYSVIQDAGQIKNMQYHIHSAYACSTLCCQNTKNSEIWISRLITLKIAYLFSYYRFVQTDCTRQTKMLEYYRNPGSYARYILT
jgi:hypothetical protein